MSRRWRWCAWLAVVLVLAGLLVLLGSEVASAASPVPPAPPPAPAPRDADLNQVLTNVRNWLMGFLAAGATLFFTVGAVRYMGSGTDPGEVDAAKRCFRNAALGYGLAILAPLLLTALRSVVGG
ncbi:hypothetical protein I6A60_40310 [Frankia sp. AgB1.9]|nr:hypothetical protein [Frankia sp. AgW1.1]MBL7554027.1 hypothetical protein [Frankia sp. AgB1.9]MBL7618207.1 hypothetical protein [Frankia sp. AgB1.8]